MPVRYLRHPKKDYKRLYGIYHGIKKRCYNVNSPRYKDYGGRGIVMCDEWLNPDGGYDLFCDWALANGYEEDLTIERIDVNGNYCPENCKWITLLEQGYNKRTTDFVEYHGETKCLRNWCDELGLNYYTVHKRLSKGWSVERAFVKPEKSFAQMCREHGMKPSIVKDRVNKLGWSLEDALKLSNDGYNHSDEMCEKLYGYTVCPVCNKRFLKRNRNARCCSIKCGDYYKRHRDDYPSGG